MMKAGGTSLWACTCISPTLQTLGVGHQTADAVAQIATLHSLHKPENLGHDLSHPNVDTENKPDELFSTSLHRP